MIRRVAGSPAGPTPRVPCGMAHSFGADVARAALDSEVSAKGAIVGQEPEGRRLHQAFGQESNA